MKVILIPIGILAFIVFVVWVINATENSDKAEITAWAAQRSETVQEIERRILNTGPFIITENYRIYHVRTSEGVYWFRYGLFSPDIYKGETNATQLR